MAADRHNVRAQKVVNRFERAVLHYNDLGSIPVFSDDPEEQALIDKTRSSIKRQYTRARNALVEIISKES